MSACRFSIAQYNSPQFIHLPTSLVYGFKLHTSLKCCFPD